MAPIDGRHRFLSTATVSSQCASCRAHPRHLEAQLMTSRHLRSCALALVALLALTGVACAIDAPGISVGPSGHGTQVITITAGDSGLPYGFSLWWMPDAQFDQLGYQWPDYLVEGEGAATFDGT